MITEIELTDEQLKSVVGGRGEHEWHNRRERSDWEYDEEYLRYDDDDDDCRRGHRFWER
jgi:hypothetical protein